MLILSTLLFSASLALPLAIRLEEPVSDTTFWKMHLTYVPYEQRRLELDFGVPSTLKRRSRKEIFLSWMAQDKSN